MALLQNLSAPCRETYSWLERTSPSLPFGLDLQTTLVDEVECLHRVPAVDHAGDVDFVRALADHFDVHVALAERGEHATRNTDHVPHRLPDQRENGHVSDDLDLSDGQQHVET